MFCIVAVGWFSYPHQAWWWVTCANRPVGWLWFLALNARRWFTTAIEPQSISTSGWHCAIWGAALVCFVLREYFLCALKLAWYVNCRCIDTYRYRVSQKSKPDYYCNNFVYCQPTLIGWQLTKELKCQAKSCWPLKISGQFIFIMHFELCAC